MFSEGFALAGVKKSGEYIGRKLLSRTSKIKTLFQKNTSTIIIIPDLRISKMKEI